MSLQVKFPFGRGHAPVHTCRTCGYMTRHRAMFERHTKRCSSEMASGSQRSSPSQPLPSPPVCRNYRCEKCGFATSKSKLYLHHRREIHGENFSIYPCDQCEYASRHKSKVIRHRSLVHKDVPSDPEFPKELDSSQKTEELREIISREEVKSEIKVEYESADEDEDVCMQPDENQNTPVKKKLRLMTSEEKNKADDVKENGVSGELPEDADSPSAMTFIPDPTEDAYKYILGRSDDSGSPLYVCSLCTYNNSHKWKVATHVRNVHMRKTLFKCPYCEFVTERKIEWCVHKTAHTEKVVHSCQECSYRTTMKRNFERHLAHHVMEGPFKCTLCSYSSTGEAAVQRHIAEYHPSPDKQLAIDSIHTADGVTAKSASPGPLIISDTSDVEQPKVETSTRSGGKAPSQGGMGHEVQCKLCGVWFKNETRLRIHMVSHSDEAPHVCPICKLCYKRPADLNRHMKRKHGTKSEDLPSDIEQEQPLDLCVKKSDDELETDPDKPLDLSCKSSSSSPSPMHVYRTSEIKCSYCSYMAKWPSDLRRHMLVHSVEKRYQCHVCNKKYKYQFDLNMHMRKSHRLQAGRTRVSSALAFGKCLVGTSTPKDGGASDVKVRQLRRSQPKESQQIVEEHYTETGVPEVLKCSYCDYIGKYPAEVQRHELLHTGSQPYLCLFCTYRTFWKGDVKRHLVKHHKTEVDRYGELPELVNLCYKPQGCQNELDGERTEDDASADYDDVADCDLEAEMTEMEICDEMKQYVKEIDGRKLYKCPDCTLAYDSPLKLKAHLDTHEQYACFVCSECGERSSSRYEIEMHLSAEHPKSSATVLELMEDEAGDDFAECVDSLRKHPKVKDGDEELSQDDENGDYVEDLEALANIQGLDDYARVMNPDSIEDEDDSSKVVYRKPHSLLDSIPGGPHTLAGADGMDTLIATVAAGRYRRFKCSTCGKRSNWKWDIKKHIRCSHHSAQVIEMTEDEAKATFHEVLKTKSKDDVYRFDDDREDAEVRPKWRPFKCPGCGKRSNVKAELKKHMTDCAPDAEMIVMSEAEAEATFVAECGHYVDKKQESASTDPKVQLGSPDRQLRIGSMPKVKKYKCSICPYRSDYRSDISRHLKRKHYKAKGKILILRAEYAAATLPSYKKTWARKKFVISPDKVQDLQEEGNTDDLDHCVRVVDPEEEEKPRVSPRSVMLVKSPADEEELAVCSSGRSPNKVWQCSKCDYQNNNKMVIVSHFKTHGQGHAFQCKVCPYTSDYRGSIYRHVKAIHKRKDYQNVISYCALMEVDGDTSTQNGSQSQGVTSDVKPPEAMDVVYVVKMFQCKLCPSKTIHKHNLVRHIKEKHPDVADPHSKVTEVETITKKPPTTGSPAKSRMKFNKEVDKVLKCDLCPFKTLKFGLLKIHSQFHKPQGGEQFKCKYCPFYVSTMRRLIQHMQLHEQGSGEAIHMNANGQSSLGSGSNSPSRSGGKARHFCEKCPYVSINKNDFIYHKQFHRPKPSAPFKCEFCPYWVSLRRLLTQHKKVHSPEYKLQYYPREMVSGQESHAAQEKRSSSPPISDRTDLSMEMDDMVEVAHLKQQIITSKITTVPISPEKLKSPKLLDRADDTMMRGYVVDSSGRLIMNRSYQKLHRCRYCPYTNVRLANLCLHEKMHGRNGGEKELYQCNYCDYQVGNKGLLSHHIKVHSVQYQPGRDDINDVQLMDENMKFISESNNVEVKTEEEDGTDKNRANEENNNYMMKFEERETIATDPSMHLEVSQLPNRAEYYIRLDEKLQGPVLEKAMMKKWCCEQCPYVTLKRAQFEKHLLLHGSKQKYACEFCDYSVPGYHLLLQHKRLHLMPNNNLLSVQSVSNLRRLPELPADVATAAQFGQNGLQVHDSLDLYENSPDFVEPRKLFRCDRCPYTNSRRDHLLSHLKFHMICSDLRCPHCDYSVSKVHLLNQHIRVHFSTPGTEMSAEPKAREDIFVKKESSQPDFFTALELKQLSKPEVDNEKPTDLSLKSKSSSADTKDGKDQTLDSVVTAKEECPENDSHEVEKINAGDVDGDGHTAPANDGDGGDGDGDGDAAVVKSESEDGDEEKPAKSCDEDVAKTVECVVEKVVSNNDTPASTANATDTTTAATAAVAAAAAAAADDDDKVDGEDKAGTVNGSKQENTDTDKGKHTIDGSTDTTSDDESEKICKYCERCFTSLEKLTCHEKQHLLGSEVTVRS